MPGEILTLFCGQGGCQMGSAIWELLCAEHGIGADGNLVDPEQSIMNEKMYGQEAMCGSSFFFQGSRGQYVPRSLFTDLEATVVDQIRTGYYRELFHPDYLVSGQEDAANVFARGYHSLGTTKVTAFMESLRGLVEECESVAGLMSVHSTGGGSGSGYNSLILEQVKEEFPKTLTIECSLSPSGVFSTNMVEPYNSLMAAHYTMPTVDVCFLFDNDALYHLCTQKIGIRNPSYNHLNRLTSQIYSSMTACMRFGGCLASNLSDYQTNLVPYPRIRFPVTSYAPLSSPDRSAHEPRILDNMTKDVFKRTSMLCTCNTDKGKFVSCCLMYRGDVNPAEVYGCIAKLKSFGRIQFVDWCPTGMKLSVCQTSPVIVPSSFIAPSSRNVMLMSNSSAIGEIFQRIATRYELLFKKRSFVHWFVGEGMEEGEFNDAIIDLQTLVVDYNQCCDLTSPDNDEEDLMKCIQQAQMETSQDNPILSSPPVAEFSDDSKRDEPEMTDEEPN